LQGFKSRIEDVREEILRKRRAGKLPGDTTSILKQWWQQHSKWPYPTVSALYSYHMQEYNATSHLLLLLLATAATNPYITTLMVCKVPCVHILNKDGIVLNGWYYRRTIRRGSLKRPACS
jgi:hypothetical protein